MTAVAVSAAVSLAPAPGAAPQPPAASGAGGRPVGGGRGRARAPPPPPAGPTPRLPNDPYLGANAGKPDLGGNSQSVNASMRGIWQVPYIIDMQKQGKTV